MEPGGQKRELPHTTTPARDPNRKRPTLHSQQKVSTLPFQQEKERFLLTQQQTQPMGTIASQAVGSLHHQWFVLVKRMIPRCALYERCRGEGKKEEWWVLKRTRSTRKMVGCQVSQSETEKK